MHDGLHQKCSVTDDDAETNKILINTCLYINHIHFHFHVCRSLIIKHAFLLFLFYVYLIYKHIYVFTDVDIFSTKKNKTKKK